MKKSFSIFQILIFVWMQIAPMHLSAQEAANNEIDRSNIPPMPKNYRLPDMRLLDTVAFYQRYKDKVGQRIDVEGFVGRFGATFGDDFRQKIYEIEQQYKEKIQIILTLSSTLEDAKVLKQRLESKGHTKMVIVEIPDWLQQKILEKSERATQSKLNQVMWESKMQIKQIANPKAVAISASNAIKILKNQYVPPTRRDIKIAAVTATQVGILAGVGIVVSVGVDSMTVAAVAAAIAMAGGATLFSKTIGNILKVDMNDELKIMNGFQKMAVETFYAIGLNGASALGSYDVNRVVSDSVHTVIHGKASEVKEKKLSEEARNKLYWYTFAFGSALGLLGKLGIGTHPILEYSFFELNTLELVSMSVTASMIFAYIYKAPKIEKFIEKDVPEIAVRMTQKLPAFRKMKAPEVTMTVGRSCSLLFSF